MLTDAAAIRRLCLDATADDACIGLIAWMHTFSPAKMWIGGLEALGKPLLHLHTQANVALPWADIDMDFMNLNQAAHGDREFGYIQTRLGVAPQDRRRPRVRPAGDRRGRRPGRGPRPAGRRPRSLKLARFGDNMRYVAVTEGDKTEAEVRLRRPGQHLGRQRPGRGRGRGARRRHRRARRRVRGPLRRRARAAAGRRAARVAALRRARSSSACARSSTAAGSARSPPTSRTSAACASCPASPCSG